MKLSNFRNYKEEIVIDFDNLTAFVGKNDIGKSSILEALDIFFNEGKGSVKLDKGDINKQSMREGNNEIRISLCFDELPDRIVIDATNETSLQTEYLVNSNNQLEAIKKYPNAGAAKVFIKRTIQPTRIAMTFFKKILNLEPSLINKPSNVLIE